MNTLDPTAKIERPLETLSHAHLRVNSAMVRIQNFLDRFHGAQPEADGLTEAPIESYRDGIERLFAALDRLENRVDKLDQIG